MAPLDGLVSSSPCRSHGTLPSTYTLLRTLKTCDVSDRKKFEVPETKNVVIFILLSESDVPEIKDDFIVTLVKEIVMGDFTNNHATKCGVYFTHICIVQ